VRGVGVGGARGWSRTKVQGVGQDPRDTAEEAEVP
jgi:hypothetical protein